MTKTSGKRPTNVKRFEDQGERFLDSIVTEDETWVLYKTSETKKIHGMVSFQFTE